MNSQASPILLLLFSICLVLVQIPLSSSNADAYTSCSRQFNCGGIKGLGFPFWGGNRTRDCGYPGLELTCKGDVATMDIGRVKYRALNVYPDTQVLQIAREDYMGGFCPSKFVNTTLDSTLLDYVPDYMNLSIFYGCPTPFIMGLFNVSSCSGSGFPYPGAVYASLLPQSPGICGTSVTVPVLQSLEGLWNWAAGLGQALQKGFEVKWKVDGQACSTCIGSGGVCGYDFNSKRVTCFCPNQTSASVRCPSTTTAIAPEGSLTAPAVKNASGSQSSNRTAMGGATISSYGSTTSQVPLKIGLFIAGAAIFGILIGFLVFHFRQRKKRLAAESQSKDLPTPPSSKGPPILTTDLSQSIPSYPSSKSDLGKGSTYFGVHVFSYTELEEATNNFDASRELGEGGFGTVYYGVLHDGRVIAVKRLYENNFKRVEQFMNEVEILTRLRHKNLVVLYGCTSKRSRELLLVYEYIPNGTVADHLHGKKANSGKLTWAVRLSIAIETADALAYLHASDIIHRDVKTNNILLDNDFHVKVADFGLSRLFPTDVTHVSTAPQGTPGYVDPEYYQCYQLTDKSDVYSFGVVLIELISSKEAVDTNRHRHDINLANMAVNKIQNHTLHELVDPSLGFETDYAIRRVTTAVAELAFRCLQQERDMRPTMEEVLQVLRGIENEDINAQKPEVVDIRDDDIGLLKSLPPPVSPDSVVTVVTDKWVPNSF